MTSKSAISTTHDPHTPTLCDRHQSSTRRPFFSAAASATNSTTGCASMSPANIAPRRASTAFGQSTPAAGSVPIDTYQGDLKSWVFLANAYVDLGTWNCFTPFVGAGIGGAATRSTTSPTSITYAGRGSVGVGRNPSKWNFAWALYAGVGYKVTKNFKIELAYRYLELRLDHRHRRLLRRQWLHDFKFKRSDVARHQARPALDLLRVPRRRSPLRLRPPRLHAAAGLPAAAAAAQQRLRRGATRGAQA